MSYNPNRALELLRLGVGNPQAEFRDQQLQAIEYVVQNSGRLLVVQKTGWGKSFVYFIATKILREAGHGPTLLISPLLALMRNQIQAAKRMGVNAVSINSNNTSDWQDVTTAILRNEADIILVSPERLTNDQFVSDILAHIAQHISLLVIDEAHCISDWGHDFRPKYRTIERIMRTLPRNLRLLATTATANNRVMDDLMSVLGPELQVLRGDLHRPSLLLQTIRLPDIADRLAWLAESMRQLEGSGIVYVLTKRDAHMVSDWLQSQGFNVAAYTGGDDGDHEGEREHLEQALQANQVKALIATSALGMGFDKPDLSFVFHFQSPGSVVSYYQQVGRAGRALHSAYGVLLSGEEEQQINDYFINTAFPTRTEVSQIIEALELHPEGLSVPQMCTQLNISKGRIDKTIDLLSLESPAPIVKMSTHWMLTISKLSEEFWDRAERLTALRRREQQQMKEYVALESGHMGYLIQSLDGDPSNVQTPDIPPLPTAASPELVQEALTYLHRKSVDVTPRAMWPAGGMPAYDLRGTIQPAHRMKHGKALCYYGDTGWGDAVRRSKYIDGVISDELVAASAKLILEWAPQPFPAWVTCIPSLRHPNLVPRFAQHLAQALNIPYHEVLRKTENRPEQKSMANSIQQARNVDGSLVLITTCLPSGAVLLVDDMVDSKWTFTVASWLLRTNGSGSVIPYALAYTGNGE